MEAANIALFIRENDVLYPMFERPFSSVRPSAADSSNGVRWKTNIQSTSMGSPPLKLGKCYKQRGKKTYPNQPYHNMRHIPKAYMFFFFSLSFCYKVNFTEFVEFVVCAYEFACMYLCLYLYIYQKRRKSHRSCIHT